MHAKFRKPLATMQKHKGVHEHADMQYRKGARRMKERFEKHHKVKRFQVGQSVTLRIPHNDRTSTDPQRLACVVLEVVGKAKKMYRLQCKSGVLNTCYSAGDLEEYSGSFDIPVTEWRLTKPISLRKAVRCSAPWSDFDRSKCNCTKGCDTMRCHCKKNSTGCSSFCHKGSACKNKGSNSTQQYAFEFSTQSSKKNTKTNQSMPLTTINILIHVIVGHVATAGSTVLANLPMFHVQTCAMLTIHALTH